MPARSSQAGKAWGVSGDRGGGKSTTMAGLALDGVPIVSDDLLVLDGLQVLPAPRSVDLRRTAAAHLGVGTALGVVGARERWRLKVEQLEGEYELAGWIFLRWGERLQGVSLRPTDRFMRLRGSRGTRLPPRSQHALLELTVLARLGAQPAAALELIAGDGRLAARPVQLIALPSQARLPGQA